MKPRKPRRKNKPIFHTGQLKRIQDPHQRLANSLNSLYKLVGSKHTKVRGRNLKNPQNLQSIIQSIDGLVMALQSYLYKTDDVSLASRQTGIYIFRESANRNLMAALEDPVKSAKTIRTLKEIMLAMSSLGIAWKAWPFNNIYTNSIRNLEVSPRGQRILEIGAGIEGMAFMLYEKSLRPHQIVLLDKHPFICDLLTKAIAQNKTKHMGIVESDILNYAPKGKEFDVIFASLILRYLPKDRRSDFIRKLSELAAKDAKVILVDSNFGLDDPITKREIEEFSAEHNLTISDSIMFQGNQGQPAFAYILTPA